MQKTQLQNRDDAPSFVAESLFFLSSNRGRARGAPLSHTMRKRDYSIPTTTRAAPATRTARAARRARLARFGALLAGVVFSLALIRRAATAGRVSTVATEKAAVAR